MKVILCEDVDNLGHMGDTVKVAPGYARNFLIPRKLAVVAESATAKQIEHEMRIIRKREEKKRAELSVVRGTLEGLVVEFTAKAGEEGKLFGSITTLHIAEKLREIGHDVTRKSVKMAEPIKTLGDHEVSVRLMKDLDATLKVKVVPEAAPEPEPVDEAEGMEDADTMAEATAAVDEEHGAAAEPAGGDV